MENKSNIAKAIINVMKEVKGIDKSKQIGTGASAYMGVPDQEVKKIIGESMTKHGLCIVPTSVDANVTIERWEETYNGQPKQKQSIFTEVKTKYLLLHDSGEYLEIAGTGHGVDTQDKSAGKATTYALKYALLYMFLVPTGKLDDADNDHSDSKDIPTSTPKAPVTPPKIPATTTPLVKVVLTEQHPQFDSVKSKLAKGEVDIAKIEQHYNVSDAVKTALIKP